MNNVIFLQFCMLNAKVDRYDLCNGFSDTWDFCKNKGDFMWVAYEVTTTDNAYQEKIDPIQLPFKEGTVYSSCSFPSHLHATVECASRYPNVKFVAGGPASLYYDYEYTTNIEIFQGTVEEYFEIPNYSYKWDLEIPDFIAKNKHNMKQLRYHYGVRSYCYWKKCTYCILDYHNYRRSKKLEDMKTHFKRFSNIEQEMLVIGTPAIPPKLIKNWMANLTIEDDVILFTYIRPDSASHDALKNIIDNGFEFTDNLCVNVGPEVLSERMLKRIKKGVNIQEIKNFINLLHEHSMKYIPNFIIGWPDLIKSDITELKKNIHIFNKKIYASVSVLGVRREGMVLSKVYPPPDSFKEYWYNPLSISDIYTINLNIQACFIFKGYFDLPNDFNLKKLLQIRRSSINYHIWKNNV